MKRLQILIILIAIILFFLNSCAPKPTKKVPLAFESGQKHFHNIAGTQRVHFHKHRSDQERIKQQYIIKLEYLISCLL